MADFPWILQLNMMKNVDDMWQVADFSWTLVTLQQNVIKFVGDLLQVADFPSTLQHNVIKFVGDL